MKKYIITSCSLFCLTTMLVPVTFASAKTTESAPSNHAVDYSSLRVANPTFLVGNPFYGIIDSVRGMSVTWASGRLGRVSALIDQLNRKAAELLKIRSIAPDNTRLISRATNEYQLAVYQYKVAARQLTTDDITADTSGTFIDNLINATFTNLRFIDEQLAYGPASSEQAVLTDVFDQLTEATVKLFSDAVGFDSVRIRVLAASGSNNSSDIRVAEMCAVLGKRAAAMATPDAARQLFALRGTLLDAVAGDIGDKISAAEIGALAGSHTERIQTISYLLGQKDLSSNADLINLRNRFLLEVFSK